MQALIDAAVVVVTVVIPSLDLQLLQKFVHKNLLRHKINHLDCSYVT